MAVTMTFVSILSDKFRWAHLSTTISAFEVESVTRRHPDVMDAAMVGVPGEQDIQLCFALCWPLLKSSQILERKLNVAHRNH
jgi:acyl-coenzyme A synthetase/AMP-(fatty) acid ligase